MIEAIALTTVLLALPPSEQPLPGYSFGYAVPGETQWSVLMVPDDPNSDQFVEASGPWTGDGVLVFTWLLTDGTSGSGGTYKDRLRACVETAKAGCKPNPVCWSIYTESGGSHGVPSTTSCLVICKDGSNPCPPPPSTNPPGKSQPVPGDG